MNTVKEIYDTLNSKYECKEIYIEDFQTEQIFYQVEDLVNKVIEKNEIKINKYLKLCEKECNKTENIKISENDDINLEKSDEISNDINDIQSENNKDYSIDSKDEKEEDFIEFDASSEFSFDKESNESEFEEDEEINIDDLKELQLWMFLNIWTKISKNKSYFFCKTVTFFIFCKLLILLRLVLISTFFLTTNFVSGIYPKRPKSLILSKRPSISLYSNSISSISSNFSSSFFSIS